MAYQPIQMPGGLPSFGIADAVMEARRAQRQKQQDAWEQMYRMGEGDRAQQRIDLEKQRQQQQQAMEQARLDRENQDRQVDIQQKVLALHDKGLSHEADQIAQMYGLHGQQQAPDIARPQEPQRPAAPGPQPQPPEFVGPLETPDMARERGAEDHALGADFANEQTTAQAGDEAANEVQQQQAAREQYGQASRQFAAAREAQGAYPQQVLDYRDKQAQYDEAAKHAPIAYAGKGMSFMVNPLERHQAQAAQNAERADTLLAALKGTPLAPYGGVAAAMAKSGLVDPKTIFADVDAMAKAQAEIERKNAGEPAHSPGRFEQEKELAQIRAAAAERAAGGIKPLPEATDLGHEMGKALEPVTDKRLGIAARQRMLKDSVGQVTAQPNNPVAWTNFIDGMIRTNTGKAAIIAQYNLYLKHAGGAAANFESWVEGIKTGNVGGTVRQNLLGATHAALGELAREGGEAKHTFHRTYSNDPRIKRNPEAKAKFEAMESTSFSDLADHPAADDIGAVRDVPGMGKMRKVDDNHWEPVQ